jgi:hypothetical protein
VVDGLRFGLRATDTRLLDLFRRHMKKFRVDSGDDEFLYSADCGEDRVMPGGKVVRGIQNLYMSTVRLFRGGILEEMAARVVLSVRDLAARDVDEFVKVRAGCVALDGGAVLFPSRPQRHLPALVAALVREGGAYLGDELVYLDPVLWKIHPPPPMPLLIDSKDLPHFPELDREPSRKQREEDWDTNLVSVTPRRLVSLEELGGKPAEASRLSWIVFPEFEPGERTRLEPFGGSEAAFRLLQAGLNLHVWGDRTLTLMQEIVESTPVSRLVVGSPVEAARLVRREAPRIVREVMA